VNVEKKKKMACRAFALLSTSIAESFPNLIQDSVRGVGNSTEPVEVSAYSQGQKNKIAKLQISQSREKE